MQELKIEIPSTITVTLDELLFVSIPSKDRAEVIEASVTIERIITTMLAIFLNIDVENSKSFGKSGLSFNSKLHLLADIKMINRDEKAKLIKFSEIRNIFAHDSKTFMFSQCFEQNDLKAYLTKKYSVDNNSAKDRDLFIKLFDDVKVICRELFNKMMLKAEESGRQKGTIEFFHSLRNVLADMSAIDADFKTKVDNAYDQAKRNLAGNNI